MIFLRRIIFYILLMVYLVTCPLVILYALGYAYKPGHDPHIMKMGVISLSTVPSGASVYLGRSRFTEKTPTVLMDLYPGEYVLKIMLENHRPWVRKIPVESGRATVLEDIILVPANLDAQTVAPESFDDLNVISQTPFFLLSKGSKLKDKYVFYWRKAKPRPLLPAGSKYAQERLVEIFGVRKSPTLILHVKGESGDQCLRLNLRGNQTRIKNLSGFVKGVPGEFMWDAKAENQIYYLNETSIGRMDLSSGDVFPNLAERVRGAGFFDQKVYLVREDDVLRTDRNGKEFESLLSDAELGKSLFGGEKSFRVEQLKDGALVFWQSDGKLVSNRFPHQLVEDGVLGAEPNSNKSLLLIWQKSRIGIVDFQKESAESDDAFEKGAKLRWIYANGSDIQQAFWVSDRAHILFRDGTGAYLLETFKGVESGIRFLARVKENSSVYYAEPTGKLYYLESQYGKLSTIELLEKNLLAPVKRTFEGEKFAAEERIKSGLSFLETRSK